MNDMVQMKHHPTLAIADQVLAPTYTRPAHLFVEGEGSTLRDAQGRAFLDMTSGVAVNALGHGSPIIQKAMAEAMKGLIHTSNLYHTAPAIELAAMLVRHSFADKVFFANSGAESTEGAIKFARLYGGEARKHVISFRGCFHGRTLGALRATDREKYQAPFRPLPEGFSILPWGEMEVLSHIDEKTAAVLVEPIQGEGGIRLSEPKWIEAIRRRCDEVGALLVFDEVQAGLGRTGRLWAHEHYDVRPDMMTLAKPLAGGLPMGAVLMTDEVASRITPGCHATTFGGGVFVASVALAVLQEITRPGFLDEVLAKGHEMRERLRQIESPLIREVRGVGLFVGVELTTPPAEVLPLVMEEGLLVVPAANNVIRFLPSLNASRTELEEATERFARALSRV